MMVRVTACVHLEFLLPISRQLYGADEFLMPIDEHRYERDRSASPRPSKRDDDYPVKQEDSYRGRDRSASPNGRMDSR